MHSIVEKNKSKIFEIFDHLHSHPEISWQEYATTEYIKGILEAYDCKITTFDDVTGIIGEIGDGKPTVGLRSDMDALWQEVDGEFQANHSCGHDAHMTLALGTLIVLKELTNLPKGKIKFIFQPAEEKGTGALKFIEKGVVDDIDYLYGVHLRPYQDLTINQAASSVQNGAACLLSGKILGDDSHGARPHLGANAIEVGATLIEMFNKIHINPLVPNSIKMTKFMAGGDSANIIPGKATFSIDIRAQTNEKINLLVDKVYKAVYVASDFYDVKIELEKTAEIVAAEINSEAKRFMGKAIHNVLGKENVFESLISSGGEDFHFYTIKRPTIKATMLGLGCDLKPGLHHPNMSFDKNALISGVEILANVILETLNNENKADDQ